MKDTQKIEIAEEFISLHKDQNFTGDSLGIFSLLSQGEYGEVREDGFGNYQVEIPGHKSKTGNPITFEWEGAPIYMNIQTGSTGSYADWFYENELNIEVNAVDLGEVVKVVKNSNGDWEKK